MARFLKTRSSFSLPIHLSKKTNNFFFQNIARNQSFNTQAAKSTKHYLMSLKEEGELDFPDFSGILSPSNLKDLQKKLQKFSSSKPTINFKYAPNFREAAVLLPICIDQDGEPSIIFTVRTSHLTSHPGEISFPGGKKDPEDDSLLATALRETREEIGLYSKDLVIIGSLPPVPNHSRTIKVHGFVGVIKEPKPTITINRDEVENYFTIPIRQLIHPDGVAGWDAFRKSTMKIPRFYTPNHVQGEIWGLTGFLLYTTLKTWFPKSFIVPSL